MILTSVSTKILEGFDDPTFGPERWERLLHKGDTDVVYLTWHWQRAWWEALGSGELLLIVAERNGEEVALAPFYAHRRMIFFVGSGESDYLDFIGDVGDPEILDTIIETARDRVTDFIGFRFFAVLDSSRTGERLKKAADRLGLMCVEEAVWPAPAVDLAGGTEAALAAANGRRLLKRERFFRHRGRLEVRQFREGEAILPHLEEFFEQHISRWEKATDPSPFLDPKQRAFIERLTMVAAHTGWPRFTRLDWAGRPIAFEYGWQYRNTYFGGPSCFAMDLACRSPGQVLLRHLLLSAIDDGVSTYDFGMGDEPYKFRFASRVNYMRTWGLYPTGP